MTQKTLIVFCLLFAWISGSTANSTRLTDGVKDTAEMHSVVVKLIPLGTSEETAKKVMKEQGFTVDAFKDASVSIDGKVLNHKDFLECTRDDGGSIVLNHWMITLFISDGVIRSIHTEKGLIGP